ncbi:MAG: AbrB/MazE/SpoVT family DNA-binding domain-containing protein [Actinomycetota bacterium]|nr:AbrB/MazE/SpoVT family DNA-binding domain-containing protein [Actinomycetota bacterium]
MAVQKRGLIAIPVELRARYHLDEAGAQVEFVERDDEIVLRTHVAVPADQAWLWGHTWREMEREANDDIAAGRVESFNGTEEPLAELDR